jgi:hypothetical protein
MIRLRLGIISMALLPLILTGCSTGTSSDDVLDEAMASLEAKIPTTARASVRVCESVYDGSADLSTQGAALQTTISMITELETSDDPNGMKSALIQALLDYGDALVAEDPSEFETAALNVADVCTDIVSGEYGQ